MTRTRWIGLAAMAIGLLAATGCASSSENMAPSTPYAGAEPSYSSSGYDQPSYAPGAAPAQDAASRSFEEREAQASAAPSMRPGLGTEWGETRISRISTVRFERANPSSPFVTAAVFYNDAHGARAMANSFGFQWTAPRAFTMAGGAVAVGLRGEDGRFLSGFEAGDRQFVVGEAGMRYSIVLKNLTPNRFEAVVSVDGLDVIDGRSASFAKRGYILDPHGELEIDGFRQSLDEVAAFRFGSVRDSYANQKHGDARNVGVIGVALFHEMGTDPWTPGEVRRRNRANPFPGQFATPPGMP